MTVVTVGIDLAKNVFAVHGVNAAGKAVLVKPLVRRAKLLELIATLPACLIGIEACTGAHYWAREFQKMGHTVRIMAPQLVSPYRMSGRHGKNDAADAAAICEAVARPNMRFVPIKSVEQQGQLFVHRAHQGYVSERTALINRIRGLLSELGIVLPQAFKAFLSGVAQVLEDLPGYCNQVIGDLLNELYHIEEKIKNSEKLIQQLARDNSAAQLLMQFRGIGPMTATAIVASIGNGHDFKNGRQFSAWLGLTPRQQSSGGKARLGRITKAGDSYLRTLLVLGARSVLLGAAKNDDPVSRWALQLKEMRGYGRALVAIAAKNARMCWAMLHLRDEFRFPA
ncbi:IS110 family transposase (plasmid) [Escherichia coli]|nr:IS110 family transposase [Escherichia coli]QMP57332.1 IS110 family transposase [Escherichia coli]QMP62005.1 IS110 family transposase [Escherichia coli]QMP66688.1 IS110 family transposase [Escherichia coli]QMP71360.1 IS110 family transposase [Escherichia coli]